MTENKKTAVFGIYSTLANVDDATYSLLDAGFFAPSISVLLPENIGDRQIGTEKATKAPEGAAAGASSGAILGGTLCLLAGMGALAIPGVGPLIAAGPLMATLAGIGVGGAVGGFAGALIGMGMPEYEAKLYEGHLQKGAILLAVHCDSSDEIKRAKEVLKTTGAENVSSAGESPTDSADSEQTLHHSASRGGK
jgi:hypothetical protein